MSEARVAPEVATAAEAEPLAQALRVAVSALFVLVLPLLIVSLNLRALVFDRDFMLAQFARNNVGLTTGLDPGQLEQVAVAFAEYFRAPHGRMDVQVEIGGVWRPLFNERELAHMEDVQALVQFFLNLVWVGLAVAAARLVVAAAIERSASPLGRDLLLGALLMVAVVALVGVLSLLDFGSLWYRFHQVAFRNDLWLLDPRTDYLIRLFPKPAWFAYTLRLAATTATSTALVAVAGFLLWRFGRG